MRTRKARYIQDDAVPLAGWVFADLLLSLSIIFLTSISFDLPGDGGDDTEATINSNSVSAARITNPSSKDIIEPISEGLTKVYSKFDENKIREDINNYKTRKGLSGQARVVFAQIIGGFDSSAESSDKGTLRATAFLIALHKANMQEFKSTGLHLSTSEKIPNGYVMVRISLANYFE